MKKVIFIIVCTLLIIGCGKLNKKDTRSIIRGFNYNKNQEYTKALVEFKKAYNKNKKNELLTNEIAYSYSRLGDYENSKKYYKKTLKLNSANEKAIINLAILNYKEKNYEEVKKILKTIPKDSMNYKIYVLNAYLLEREKKYEKAYKMFLKAMAAEKFYDYEFTVKYVRTLKNTGRDNEIYPYLYNLYEKTKLYHIPKIALEYTSILEELYNDQEKEVKILNESLLYRKNDEVILKLAKISIKNQEFEAGEAYLETLSESYKYNAEVQKLWKRLKKERGE